ncbi:MAG TPA: glycosyltransferase family 4 protein [Candidatus Binatia bacterium]|nr:glycosyltransferase family 4 protein [Candidatus Binatia bacterium]
MRVAMIAPPWLAVPPTGYGGIENVLAVLVPELLNLGVEVELFTTGDSTVKATKKHWLYPNGQYDQIHKPQYEAVPISLAHLMFTLNKVEDDGGFDLIHDHLGFLGPAVLAYACRNLPPAIHTLHGPPFTTEDRIDLGIPDNLPMWRQFRQNSQLYFVGISKALCKTAPPNLKKLMLDPVHNAVDASQFPFVKDKDDYFITLARFHPEKGQAIAVKACLELGYKLKMAGGVNDIMDPSNLMLEIGNPLSRYRSLMDFRYFSDEIFPYLLDNKIEHLGEIRGADKLKVISHAKALLFPIQWEEPFGMAPIEALACGTPVVAMARGALPEIIEHGVNGFLAHNVKEFKHYMTRVDEIDPAKCRESVEKNFSAKVMAKNYLDRYKTVIAKTKRSSIKQTKDYLVASDLTR